MTSRLFVALFHYALNEPDVSQRPSQLNRFCWAYPALLKTARADPAAGVQDVGCAGLPGGNPLQYSLPSGGATIFAAPGWYSSSANSAAVMVAVLNAVAVEAAELSAV